MGFGSVQINSDGSSGQMLQQSYTFSTSNISVYCRVKFPTLTTGGHSSPFQINTGGASIGLDVNTTTLVAEWGDSGSNTTIFSSVANNLWYDFAFLKNGSNTDCYWKLATDSSWTGPVSAPTSTITPTTFTIGEYPISSGFANRACRYGKIVIWSTTQTSTVVQNEATKRPLVASSNVWFYNRCDINTSIQTDGSGAGHNFTVTGSPANNIDDPGFLRPLITTQPVNTTSYVGMTANFTVVGSSSGGTLHYQWKLNGSNVGTDASSYTTGTLSLSDDGSIITVDVSDDNDTTTSSGVYLDMLPVSRVGWIGA